LFSYTVFNIKLNRLIEPPATLLSWTPTRGSLQESAMKERRWLLPFTYRIDSEALDLVCQMAQEVEATLVAISLLAPRPGKGIQLEEIQESKDFLELVHYHARTYQVIAERHEVWVAAGDNIPSRIQTFVRDYQCDGMVVIVQQGQGVLLQTDEIAALILNPPASLVLLRLPERSRRNW
jgi:hypothetical protein